MIENKVNELFKYWDEIFVTERVEIDQRGIMGAHYMGLSLDDYFSNSIYDIDYLSINDYFETEADVKYCDKETLYEQYGKYNLNSKVRIFECILNLISASSNNQCNKEIVLKKSISFLKRIGLEVINSSGKIQISESYKLAEGTYSNIYSYNSQYYMKQLKDIYAADNTWVKRFRHEYDNMVKLVFSPYVLKVFNYDETNNSYLMEKCDCNIYDYLEKNTFISDEKILELIYEILDGMIDVHNEGIIHRDLHLGNILIKDEHVVLTDFGLSKDTMTINSLKSSSTPKNSHQFMDPVGLSDFTKLDKLSDIYSVGKIIDYITKDSSLNQKLSFCILKATDRDRNRRYRKINDLKNDITSMFEDIKSEDRIKMVIDNIKKNQLNSDVEKMIMDLVTDNRLSYFIVEQRLLNFDKLLLQLPISFQFDALCEMQDNYEQATGYGQFQNYDVFGNIASRFIDGSSELRNQKIAYTILQGCASYRFNMENELNRIINRYPNLKDSN